MAGISAGSFARRSTVVGLPDTFNIFVCAGPADPGQQLGRNLAGDGSGTPAVLRDASQARGLDNLKPKKTTKQNRRVVSGVTETCPVDNN